jgi:hypothetical protein
VSEKKFSEKELEEMQADAERARLFRDFSASPVWRKYLEPYLFKLQQEAELEAITAYRDFATDKDAYRRGTLASGRAQGAELFALFIVRGINDAKESERRLKAIEDVKKTQEAAK